MTFRQPEASTNSLPVVIIGAGPIGLAAAAQLSVRGLTPLVLEAGATVGSAIRSWGHIRTFTPWQYIVDSAAAQLLAPTGWVLPESQVPPTGSEIVAKYLEPLGQALGGEIVRTKSRVVAVSRRGIDKIRSLDRAAHPFLVRIQDGTGQITEVLAQAVIDASGTLGQRNPIGASGLPAFGEAAADRAGIMVGALPDVLGEDRARFAGRRTLVIGMGHSAANTLLSLAQLAREESGTSIVWAIRADSPVRLYGGLGDDQLAARGQLGIDLRSLVNSGAIELVASFSTIAVEVSDDTVSIVGSTPGGEVRIDGVQNVAAATGFRPDLTMLSELQLDLDPSLEAPRKLAPLIHPDFHSCGTVPPHGHRELAHPEPGFFLAGMKSYGRAPTFLIATGNEQARSIVAALAGDIAAADRVELILPETGVCSVDLAGVSGGCCSTEPTAQPIAVAKRLDIVEVGTCC